MFVQADNVEKDSAIRCDICIIGAGAAGIAMALELDAFDSKVCVIESGDIDEDKRIQRLNKIRETDLGLSEPSRARQFGGTTTVWAGRFKPHDPIDFERREWVPYSGWPVSYNELVPYYHRSAELLEAPDVDTYGIESIAALIEKSTHPLINDDQIKTEVFHWLKKKDWDWGKKFKDAFAASKNITVFLRANATELVAKNNTARVEYVRVQTLLHNQFRVYARYVVLAGGGIENARLLLLSRSAHSHGLGNEHDQVGRFYMDHPKGVVGEIKPYNKNMYLPAYWGANEEDGFTRAGLALSPGTQEQDKALNSYCLLEPVFPWSYNPGLSAVVRLAQALKQRQIPADIIKQYVVTMIKNQKAVTRWIFSKALERALDRQAKVQKITIWNFMEQAPDPNNRITLCADRDALGSQRAQLTWTINELDKRSMVVLHKHLRETLRKQRIGELQSPLLDDTVTTWPIDKDSSHHMGTTRMGTDPRTSVVDAECKLHSQENVYITGSSVFPTGGYANPTYTITALAVRLAHHLKEKVNESVSQETDMQTTTQPTQQASAPKEHTQSEPTKKKNVLIIGAGKRIQSVVVPALWCMNEQFTVSGIHARTQKELTLGSPQTTYITQTSFEGVDFASIDVIIMAIPIESVPSVLEQLTNKETKHMTLMLDTPVLPLSQLKATKYFARYKDVRVSEDTIALPPFKAARRLIDDGKIGALKHIYMFHSGYRYHALASLKYLTNTTSIKRIRSRKWNKSIRKREILFLGHKRATIIEPRDYEIGRFLIIGSSGSVADYALTKAKNNYHVEYVTNNDRYYGLKINGVDVSPGALDKQYRQNLPSDTYDQSLMTDMKIRGFMDLLNSVYEGSGNNRYTPQEGLYDILMIKLSEKVGYVRDVTLGKNITLLKKMIQLTERR